MHQVSRPARARIGVFGKIPAAGDFVAVHCNGPAARAWDSWLRAGIDNLLARRVPLPRQPVRFLYRNPAGSAACIGVATPSHDAVGRRFPICMFAELDLPVATHRFPSLPSAYGPFLDGATDVLASAGQLDLPALRSCARALPLPGPDELDEARAWTHDSLAATPGATLLEALFGPLDAGVHYHGLHMFRSACRRHRGADPGLAPIVLECPASDDVQLVFWLRAAYALLRWRRAPPCLLWSARDSRLLLSLGAPDPSVVHFVADASVTADRWWPLKTTDAAVIQRGRHALPSALLAALEPPAPTAEHIVRALAC